MAKKPLYSIRNACFLWIYGIAVSLVINTQGAYANPLKRDHVKLSGPAIYLGGGNLFAGFGASVEYQIRPKENLIVLTPFFCGGYWSGVFVKRFDYSAGAYIEMGYKQRLAIGYAYGPLAESFIVESGINNASDSIIVKDVLFHKGSSLLLGYRGMANFGLTWMIVVGAGYDIDKRFRKGIIPSGPVIGLGIGYKL